MTTRRTLCGTAVASIALILSASGAAIAQSPSPAGGDTAIPESITDPAVIANIELVLAYEDAVDNLDIEAIPTYLAPDFVSEADRFTLEHDATSNDDEILLAQKLEELYPGSENVVDGVGGWGDQVVIESTLTIPSHTATADGSQVDLEEPLEIKGIAIFTVADGRITHEVSVVDQLALLTGLGVIPPLAP